VGGDLLAHGDSFVLIRGTDFNYPLGDLAATAGEITGTLEDGTALALHFERDPGATIRLVPEPGALGAILTAWLALGAFARFRRRSMRDGCSTVLSPSGARSVALVCAAVFVAAASPAHAGSFSAQPGPWQRTEVRTPCADFNVTRNAYFGDTHVHTTYSLDAVLFNTLNTPRDAYLFANGNAIGLAPYDGLGNPARTMQLGRPLDFSAVTDHAEGFGIQSVCFLPGLPGYDALLCQQTRAASASGDPALSLQMLGKVFSPVIDNHFPPASICGAGPAFAACASRQSLFWLDLQAAAEEFYDRSSACAFTSFVAYEWTGTPAGVNLHRNVIFRNAAVPALPVTHVEEQTPQGLWAALEAQCQDSLASCDWLAIPHNSNLSNGRIFAPESADGSELTAADAATRAAMEPLVEIYQHKGSSECRLGVDSADEVCGFELKQSTTLGRDRNPALGACPPPPEIPTAPCLPRLDFVRNALKEGLLEEERTGVNPFRLGFVAGTDTHNGSPGNVREDDFAGHIGVGDATPARQLSSSADAVDNGAGGLAVVYAEENSRDALFAAMRRRETYGTSGPRHQLRFFAGNYAKETICQDPEFLATAYRDGVPMGAETGLQNPTFAVLAMKDPGDPGNPGTPLQRVQIVKGWIDASGEAQEKVFEIAGNADNGAAVDLATCTPTGPGFDSLCAAWKDPDFDTSQRAFYYARVLENPTCRWSKHVCNDNGIDCSIPANVPAEFAACCDATVPQTLQERSWASPIWYRPEGLRRLAATIAFGDTPGTDVLTLSAKLGSGSHDPQTEDIRLVVRDDDDILDLAIPAGTWIGGQVKDLGAIKLAEFGQNSSGATFMLETIPSNFDNADRSNHMVEVELRIGDFVLSQSRLWMGGPLAIATPEPAAALMSAVSLGSLLALARWRRLAGTQGPTRVETK
jgi:hypothetical protein